MQINDYLNNNGVFPFLAKPPSLIGMSYADKFRAAREALGLSQTALGDLLGSSGQHIHRLETGVTKNVHPWADKLAEALGCATEDIWAGRLPKIDIPVKKQKVVGHSTGASIPYNPGVLLSSYKILAKSIKAMTQSLPPSQHPSIEAQADLLRMIYENKVKDPAKATDEAIEMALEFKLSN